MLFQSKNKTAAETHRMLQEAFGDNAMSQSKAFLWYRRFKEGRTSVDDDERSGLPLTSTTPENIANVREVILANRRQNNFLLRAHAPTTIRIYWEAPNPPKKPMIFQSNSFCCSPSFV
jgi:hypothetical protein